MAAAHKAYLALSLSICLVAGSAQAEVHARQALHASCFSPSALAARTEERAPQRTATRSPIRPPEPGSAQAAPVPPEHRGAIRRVDLPPGSRKLVALTLDFCEQPMRLPATTAPFSIP